MDLKEQLKKVLSDQNKLERKKDDFMEEYEEKKKKILLKKKAENLSKKERKILINECKRDYESFHRLRDLKDTIMIFVSALGMILSVGGILFEEKLLDYTQFSSIFLTITLYIGGAVLAITFIHVFSRDHIDISKQMIDILEEK